MFYGQLVIGPPGSGKSTYCNGMQQLMRALNRPHAVINLDPANEHMPYDCSVAVQQLLPHSSAMELFSLGPNGALIYCVEYLLENVDWLEQELQRFKGHYLLFDCPGQVEVYTHNHAMRKIVQKLQKDLDLRLTAVHLVDSTLCTDGYKYISALLVSLSGQLLLELPHVNVLSKIDLLRYHRKELPFRLEYFAEVQDLHELLIAMENERPMNSKLKELTALLCELVEDFNLVSFQLLDIQDKESVLRVLKVVDLANGYSLENLAADLNIFHLALDNVEDSADLLDTIQERYVDVESDEDENSEGTFKDSTSCSYSRLSPADHTEKNLPPNTSSSSQHSGTCVLSSNNDRKNSSSRQNKSSSTDDNLQILCSSSNTSELDNRNSGHVQNGNSSSSSSIASASHSSSSSGACDVGSAISTGKN